MAQHIHGPLYYERMGRTGPVIAFILETAIHAIRRVQACDRVRIILF